jgi:hypothetical protein
MRNNRRLHRRSRRSAEIVGVAMNRNAGFRRPAPLIAHVVLFRLRPDVSLEERRALIGAWTAALNDIPMIRRARMGQRVRIGRSYESLNASRFSLRSGP